MAASHTTKLATQRGASCELRNPIRLASKIDWSLNPAFRVSKTHQRPALRLVVDNTPSGRLYDVRPVSDGCDPLDWRTYYVAIKRLSDGIICHTWKTRDWRNTDSWAHRQWETWRRVGWRPELEALRQRRGAR